MRQLSTDIVVVIFGTVEASLSGRNNISLSEGSCECPKKCGFVYNEHKDVIFRATWGAVGHGALYHSQVPF